MPLHKILALALASLAAMPLCAQTQSAQTESQGTSTLKVTTRLVALDVAVQDAKGVPVLDLASSDFHVTENGVEQKIVAFDPPSAHALPAKVDVHSTADLKKLNLAPVTILVLDDMNGLFEENGYARYSLERFLARSSARLAQPTALMIETNHAFHILVDFTFDRETLSSALKHYSPGLPTRRMQGGSSGDAAMERVLFTLNSIEHIAQAYAGYKGRKNVIWVGNALPGVSTQNMPPEDVAAVNTTVQRCLNILVSAHTSLYTIDPRANNSAEADLAATIEAGDDNQSALNDPSADDPFSDGENFGMIATASGGSATYGRNAIDKVIAETLTTGTNYYTLFYKPTTESSAAQQYRKIAVRVARPKLTLASRLGYYANTPPETRAAAESMKDPDSRTLLTLDLSSAALDGLQYTAIPINSVRLMADQASITLAADAIDWSETNADLVVLLVTLDAKQRILTHHVFHLTTRKSDSDNLVTNLPFKQTATDHELRVIVRDMKTGKLGSFNLPLAPAKLPR